MKHTGLLDPGLGIRPNLLRWLGEPRHAFTATNVRDAKAWQVGARRVFLKCLGDAPPPVPLRVKVLERRQLDGYSRTMLTLTTAPRVKALAWLCVPDGLSKSRGKSPAMIATPGHGLGAKDVVALDEKRKQRKEGKGYQKDYALQAVRLGYPALAIEPLGFGERRDADHISGKSTESPCQAAAVVATMLGTSLGRLRINDIRRGIDYLQEQSFVDPSRVGLMGISGGGQLSLWTTAVEPRLKAAIVSCYFNTFRHSVMAMYHCICNFAPRLAREFDMSDLAAMVAPRPMLIQAGTGDPIFPITATRAAVVEATRVYRVFNAEGRLEVDIFKGGHRWSPKKVETFLKRWL